MPALTQIYMYAIMEVLNHPPYTIKQQLQTRFLLLWLTSISMAISRCTHIISMSSNGNAILIVFKMLTLIWGVKMLEISSKNTEKE